MGNKDLTEFCGACFSGVYPTGDVTPELLESIEKDRKTVKESQLELNL